MKFKGFYFGGFAPQELHDIDINRHAHYPMLQLSEDMDYVRYVWWNNPLLWPSDSDLKEVELQFDDSDGLDENPFMEIDGIRYDLSAYYDRHVNRPFVDEDKYKVIK